MTDALLEVRDLNAWYGESHALHGIDLDVHEGETVTLLGRNGVGKTTALRSIVGIIRTRSGSIRFDGKDLLRVPLHRTARCGIGYVPEERGIFATLSVEENLTLPPVIAKGGMNLKEIYQLSGGEQQMLAMARILRTGARLLLLDEPTEGLAPVIVQRIGEVLQTLKTRGMTILLVEQNFRFASKIADRFYVVDHGKVIDRFTVGELPGRMTMLNEALGV